MSERELMAEMLRAIQGIAETVEQVRAEQKETHSAVVEIGLSVLQLATEIEALEERLQLNHNRKA